MRSVLSCLLAFTLLLVALPLCPVAADSAITADGFSYRILSNGTATVTGYVGDESDLTLPVTVDGYAVSAVSPMSFRNNLTLSTLTVPAGITSLGDAAFSECLNLREVTVEGEIDTLSLMLFRDCNQLQTISLPATVTTVEQSAFSGCTALKTVFFRGKDHSVITFAATNDPIRNAVWYDDAVRGVSGPWEYAAHSDGTATVIAYTANSPAVTVPSQLDGYAVTAVGEKAFFKNRILETVTVSNGITMVGRNAFAACTALTDVCLPDSLTVIEADAFSNCTALSSFTVPAGITHLSDGLLANAESLTAVTVPDTVTSMGNDVFFGCTNLRAVRLSDNIKTIGSSAFEACEALQEIHLPAQLEEIGENAFFGCCALETLTLPTHLTVIKERAFKDCSRLQSIRFNEDLLLIETEAFDRCVSLRHLDLPCWLYILGDGAFQRCSSLESVVLPRHLDVLRTATFAECTSLRRITLPEGLHTIEWSAFLGCTSLLDAAIPASVKTIEGYAFHQCTALEAILYGGDEASFGTIAIDRRALPADVPIVYNVAYNAFPDVSEDAWYAAAAEAASVRGWICGFANGTFGAAKPCQRQDLIVMLARLKDADLSLFDGKAGGLSDVVSNSYYAPAVAWGVEQGFMTGYANGAFGVSDPLTREQLCTVLYRMNGSPSVPDADVLLSAFPDGGQVSPYARDAVAWAVQNGMIRGMANGRLAPTAIASRAHVAIVLMRGM